MTDSYQSGDFTIERMSITSSRANIDISSIFLSASIYESIFTPGTVCDIEVLDTEDLLGTYKIFGDETVIFTYSIPGRYDPFDQSFRLAGTVTADFRFALYELGEVEMTGAQKGKKYKLKCVSEEAMYAKTNYVQKAYTGGNDNEGVLCSSIIEDIHKNYLKSQKRINLEETKTPQKIVIPHMSPFRAIEMVRKRSISAGSNPKNKNRSSLYVYFENRENDEQVYNFVTIENLFSKTPVKSFEQSALNIDHAAREDNNILSFKIPTQFKSIENIQYAGPRRITTFNFTTWQFESSDNTAPVGTVGGDFSNITQDFRNKYFDGVKIPPQSLIPIDISQRPVTNIPEHTRDLQVYLAALMQNAMKIRVPGDTLLTAGQMIECTIPNKKGFTGESEEDPLMTGNFLISRIHHKIGEFGERPRYTCVIECIKGAYEDNEEVKYD